MALTLGPPTWATGSWATNAWADDTWEVGAGGAALTPNKLWHYKRRLSKLDGYMWSLMMVILRNGI